MILKAGTYRFNPTLIFTSYFNQVIPFSLVTFVPSLGSEVVVNCSGISATDNYGEDVWYFLTPESASQFGVVDFCAYGGEWNTEYYGEGIKTITIPNDTKVEDTFGNWYIANTNYNEVNKSSLATIEYNGRVIASLNPGETALLSCAGKKMGSDIVVKVNVGASIYAEGIGF